MDLKNDKRQNIQLELDFSPSSAGEAREAGREEIESLLVAHDVESPAQTNRLMEEVCERDNLKEALRRVKANKGSAGIDRMTVDQLDDYLKQHWPVIREQLLRGTYEPKPVQRVEIPKPDGGVRKLGIPTVLDRLSSRRSCRFYNGAGIERFLKVATVFDRGDLLIKQWHRRRNMWPKATAGASTLTWRNSSTGSITTN
jgi:hypothetical protein